MLNGSNTKRMRKTPSRKSLTDRLTHMSGLSRRTQGDAPKANSPKGHQSLLLPPASRLDGPCASSPMVLIHLPAPNRRFLECTEQDLRVSEVGELLQEYRRLVEAVRSIGGFED
ncbi:hypothetical protein BS17DRAFT_811817 [Gyrodon lividus]|nr:hypothetical protein BS17DRAFT_811817 [Gyrodon lividus]